MKKITLRVHAVIFDMDGVITNTMPDHFHAWRHVMHREGIRVSHFDIYCREGQKGIDSVREIFASRKKSCSDKKARELLRKKEELFKSIVKPRFITGSRRCLKSLYRRNLTLALVTGTARHELHQILPPHLYNLFKVVVTGSDVKNGKPHPEPFRLALKRLQCKPDKAVVIENAPFGIRSANAAGLRCLAIETSLPRTYLKGAKHVFSTMTELYDKVDFIVQPNGHPAGSNR